MTTSQIEVLLDNFTNRLADLLSQGQIDESERILENFAFVMKASASTWQGDGVGHVPSMYEVETKNIQEAREYMPPPHIVEQNSYVVENNVPETHVPSFTVPQPLVQNNETLGLEGKDESHITSIEDGQDIEVELRETALDSGEQQYIEDIVKADSMENMPQTDLP